MFDDHADFDPIERRRRASFTIVPIRQATLSPQAAVHERDAADELASGVTDEDLRDDWIPRAGSGRFPGLRARAKSASPSKLSSNITIQYKKRSNDVGDDRRRPYFTYCMMALNIIMFVATMAAANFQFAQLAQNPLIGPDIQILEKMGAKVVMLIRNGQWWRLLTTGFLHTSLGHLVINMFVLYRVGGSMEETFGSISIAMIYFGSLITSSLNSCVFLPTIMSVGASGAIYGVVGSMVADYIQNYEIMPQHTLYLPSLLFNICLGFGIGLLPYIDNFAHIAGFVSGILIGFGVLILPRYDQNRNRFYKRRRSLIIGVCGALGYCIILTLLIILTANDIDGNQYCANCKYLSCIPTSYWCCQLPNRYMNC